MPKINSIHAREILDSRGNPTVEVDVIIDNQVLGRASVPSGASTGEYEALELRDGTLSKFPFKEPKNAQKRYFGKGVLAAVYNVNHIIAPKIRKLDPLNQIEVDQAMIALDGTPAKGNLGANAILAVSLAVAHAAAKFSERPLYYYLGGKNAKTLPIPLMNILNGGAHSDAPIDIQEFMIVPKGAPSFKEALRMGTEIFHAFKKVLKANKFSTSVGDEGGFAPALPSTEAALITIAKAVKEAGYALGKEVFLALDVAASEFYDTKKDQYIFKKSTGEAYSISDLIAFYKGLQKKFPIISIEDGCAENDWSGWKQLTDAMGKTTQLVGDDLFVTNTHFLQEGIKKRIANAILIKVNQIGTLTETLEAIQMAKKASYKTIISHRSGETEDTTIADLAVATNAGQIKTGSLCRTDRMCKYNQLVRIEESLGKKAIYAGTLEK